MNKLLRLVEALYTHPEERLAFDPSATALRHSRVPRQFIRVPPSERFAQGPGE